MAAAIAVVAFASAGNIMLHAPFVASAAYYAPGATLDPSCGPSDSGCGIATSTISSGTAGQFPYYADAGTTLTATSTITILQNGYVGISTSSPFVPFSVSGNGYFSGSVTANSLYQNFLQVASVRLAYRDLLFYDDFNRSDTAIGQIGTSTSGSAYDLRGVSAQVGNAATQIEDGRWVSAAGDVAYAIQTLPTNVTRMGGRVSWVTGNGGASEGAFAMLISPDKTGNNLYLNAGAHIIITKSTWSIQYIQSNTFVTVKSGTFSPELATDGTSYPFEISLNGPVMYYSFAGTSGTASSPFFVSLGGVYATWEHYYSSASVSDLLRIEAVWAGTTPVTSGNIYDMGTSGTVGVGTSTPWGKLSITNTGTSPSFIIEDSASPDTTPFVVDASGSVGIGIQSPLNKLTLYESVTRASFTGSSTATTLIMNTKGTGNYTALDLGNSGSLAAGIPESRIASLRTSSGSFLQFGTTNNFSDGITNTALTINPTGYLGIGTTTPATLLEVGGSTANVTFDGYKNCTGFTSNANGLLACTASDQRLKQDIITLDASSTLSAIASLRPVSFHWKSETERGSEEQFGFIAQDVVTVFPNLVATSSPTALSPDGTLTVNYPGLIAPLIVAVQELMKNISHFAQSITTEVLTATIGQFSQKLCLGTTCLTEAQLQDLLNNSTQTNTPQQTTTPTQAVSEEETDTTEEATTTQETASSTPPAQGQEMTATTTPDVIEEVVDTHSDNDAEEVDTAPTVAPEDSTDTQ